MRVSRLSASRRFSRASTASAKRSSKASASAMRTQLAAVAAEVGQAVGHRTLQAVHRLGDHLSERELPCPLRPGKNQRMGKVLVRQHLAQRVHRLGISMKIRKRHLIAPMDRES